MFIKFNYKHKKGRKKLSLSQLFNIKKCEVKGILYEINNRKFQNTTTLKIIRNY